jgi:hypothetical protein
MSGFFSKIKTGLSDLFGLGKSSASNQGLFNKARGWVSSGLDLLRNKNVQKGVDMLANITGSNAPRDFFMDAKKYGNIAKNLLGGKALDKKLDRTGLPTMVDRFADRFKNKRDASIELQPRRLKQDDYNLTSIFQ